MIKIILFVQNVKMNIHIQKILINVLVINNVINREKLIGSKQYGINSNHIHNIYVKKQKINNLVHLDIYLKFKIN